MSEVPQDPGGAPYWRWDHPQARREFDAFTEMAREWIRAHEPKTKKGYPPTVTNG